MAILIVMALSWHSFTVKGQNHSSNPDKLHEFSKNYTVSLITCYPGEEIYELCGHSAIRVRGEGIDSVWNYGIFDFEQPNFIYRFVKGETDYKGASYPFAWFMPQYVRQGRRVVEQDLNLTPQETEDLLKMLRESVLPENAVYRYNYVKDNCSIRILNLMDSASNKTVVYPDSIRYGTFRNEMRAYHKNYPWYQFGIDVALGSGLDYPIDSREEMFSPMDMMRNVASAHFEDGRSLVKETRILNEGRDIVVLPPTPWFLGPIFWAWVVTFLIACVIIWNLKTGKLYLPLYGIWFLILGLAGCLVFFLVFVSVHEATSPNLLAFWLNPFQFLFVVAMGIKPLRYLALTLALYNVLSCGVLLILSPIFPQSFNPAFYPLMASTLGLAGAYAIIRFKQSYKLK